jgi:putative sigma-54 modulation protein
MKVHYTGKQEYLPPAQAEILEHKFAKLARMLDGTRGEREAHVILTQERHLHQAEITVHFLDHTLVAVASDPDQFNAINSSLDKLEKQVLKLREKRRDSKRTPKEARQPEEGAESGAETRPTAPQIFRVNAANGRKPMTLEEALLELDSGAPYVAYRDAQTERLSVLIRRPDGNLDLVEG